MTAPDWYRTGLELQKHWLYVHSKLDLPASAKAFDERINRPENAFIRAIIFYARGDASHLVSFLRSNGELSAGDKALLADALEGKLKRPIPQGHPINKLVHDAAFTARHFYRDWKRTNHLHGIRDWGTG